MSSLTKVIICSKAQALHALPKGVNREDICYYLCDDYFSYSKLKKLRAEEMQIRLLGDEFHKAIRDITQEFLQFSHRINMMNQSYAFWGTHLASRNSGAIPLLKYLVFFHCASKILDHVSSNIVFVCDSRALAGLIREDARDRGLECHIQWPLLESLKPLLGYFKLAVKGIYYLFSRILLWGYARSLKNRRITEEPARERYILRSYVTTASIDKDGRYKDRNFGVLPDFLMEQGKDVWMIPMFSNLDRDIFTLMKLMSQSEYKFIFPEQYLSISDIVKTLRDGVKGLFPDLNDCGFEGRNIKLLVRDIHLSVSLHPPLLTYNGIKYLIKVFAEQNIRIDRFIYPIENNPPEKTFILGAREYYPQSGIIGFQHTVWLKEQLGVFFVPDEISYHPLPDRIVCSGRRYPDILETAGFPSGKATPGPNLRYTAINQNLKANNPDDGELRKILIILNYDTNQNLELLEKAGEAMQDMGDVRIYVKAHPTTPVPLIETFLRDIGFAIYEWASGTVQEWLEKSHAVLMTGGSVSNLETMATGVPLIRVSLENNFDFDCFWDEYPFSPFISSSEEIRKYLEKALNMDNREKERLRDFGREMVKDYFEPVTRENLKVFL